MNRTQAEIIERLRTNKKRDPFGWATMDLVEWLDFEQAKEFLKPDVTAEQWKEHYKPKPVRDQMVEYMPFAWEKANDCRGLSAGRTLDHYSNWLWLIGEDKMSESITNYEYYGKDNLAELCKFLGLESSQWDDGRRVNSEEGEC